MSRWIWNDVSCPVARRGRCPAVRSAGLLLRETCMLHAAEHGGRDEGAKLGVAAEPCRARQSCSQSSSRCAFRRLHLGLGLRLLLVRAGRQLPAARCRPTGAATLPIQVAQQHWHNHVLDCSPYKDSSCGRLLHLPTARMSQSASVRCRLQQLCGQHLSERSSRSSGRCRSHAFGRVRRVLQRPGPRRVSLALRHDRTRQEVRRQGPGLDLVGGALLDGPRHDRSVRQDLGVRRHP